MKTLLPHFTLVLICAGSLLHAATGIDEEALPPDMPQVEEVVHRLKYPYAKTWQLQIRGSQLFGDKFLNASGLALELRRFLNESVAVIASLAIYSNSATGDAYALRDQGVPPTMYNPSAIGQLGLLYAPIYGKLALGSYIQRVRLGVLAACHGAQERNVVIVDDGSALDDSELKIGGTLGLDAEFPISQRLAVGLRLEWLAHEKLNGSDRDSFRQLWQFSLGLGARL